MLKSYFIAYVALICATSEVYAREMECRYDYITFTQIRYMKELENKDIDYSWRFVDSENGTYKYEGSTELNTDEKPLKYISENLYLLAQDDWFPSIYYIDFSTATKREVQQLDSYMKKFPSDSIKLSEKSQIVSIPIQIWDCKRTD
jgi:hypothetical protein